MIEEGVRHGLPAIRIPTEPPATMVACGTPQGLGARALYAGSRVLRRQARRAGLRVNDHAFGIAWSGHMTSARVIALAPHLPPGLSELYFHPATHADPALQALMPDYEHAAELAALMDPAVRAALAANGIGAATYSP